MSGDSATDKAAQVAAGSSVVLAGNLVNRALRFATSWLLANVLGQAAFGLYEVARTWVTIVASFGPLGTDKGLVYFIPRKQAADDAAGVKGTIQASLILSAIAGPLLAAAVAAILVIGGLKTPAERSALLMMLPAAAVWSVLLGMVGTLRAFKDMKGQTLAYLIVLPVGMFAAALLPWLTGGGVEWAVIGFVGANVLSLAVAVPLVWRRVGPLLRDSGIPGDRRWGELLKYSLPESFSAVLFRINQWADVLMVDLLGNGTADVGLYRTAVTLAMIGEVPAVAVNTMFQPVVAEMVFANDPERLRKVVRIVTRWMVLLAAPVYMAIYVGMELALSLWKPEYASSADALAILLWGQAVYVLAVPVTALIPMSGRAKLNLANAGAAATLNVVLNALLIPGHGIEGAATATGISLAAWSLWRIGQVWGLMKVQAFSARSLGLIAVFVALTLGLRHWTQDATLWIQAAATLGGVAVFCVLGWTLGRTPDDAVVLDQVRKRILKKLGRS